MKFFSLAKPGEAPVSIERRSHRFCVSALKRSAGVSKLMNSPCGSPSKARKRRRLVSSRDETSEVTVRISRSPAVDFGPGVVEQDDASPFLLSIGTPQPARAPAFPGKREALEARGASDRSKLPP